MFGAKIKFEAIPGATAHVRLMTLAATDQAISTELYGKPDVPITRKPGTNDVIVVDMTQVLPQWRPLLYVGPWTNAQLERMAIDYARTLVGTLPLPSFKRKYQLTEGAFRDFTDLLHMYGMIKNFNVNPTAEVKVETEDYLVIGEGGVVMKNSEYATYILGRRLRTVQPRALGTIAGILARVYTDNPNILGAIEATGDLIETGLSGFAVARGRLETSLTPVAPPISASRTRGNEYRDKVADLMRKQFQGTGMTVHTEVPKNTPFGVRIIDIEVRTAQGKPIGGLETKIGNSRYDPSQRSKDNWLWLTDQYRVNVVREEPVLLR